MLSACDMSACSKDLGTDQQNPICSVQLVDSSTVLVAATLIVSTGQHRRENLPRQNACVPSQQNGMDAPMKAADPYVSVK